MSLPSLDGEEFPWDKEVIIPVRPILFTLDQVRGLLAVGEKDLNAILFYAGRSPGVNTKARITARNIARPKDTPDWRVAEGELIRWLKYKKFKIRHRGEIIE